MRLELIFFIGIFANLLLAMIFPNVLLPADDAANLIGNDTFNNHYNGDMFGASGTTSASDLINQKVMKVEDSDYGLGYFSERKKHALNCEGFIKTAFGPNKKI